MSKIYDEKKEIESNYDLNQEEETNMGHNRQIKEFSNGGVLVTDSNELVIEILKPKSDLSLKAKLCFAAAGLPFQMYFCAISIFVTVFLLDRAKLSPEKSTYVLFISRYVIVFSPYSIVYYLSYTNCHPFLFERIIDAITDPIYGYFVNDTKFTKYGKMKPWYGKNMFVFKEIIHY